MIVYDHISLNLSLKKREEVPFPYLDYGFLYGYGLFESIRINKGQPLLLDSHLARIERGSVVLDINYTYSVTQMEVAIRELISACKVDTAILNIYLTPGDRAQDPAEMVEGDSFLMMVIRPLPSYDPEKRCVLDFRQEAFLRTPLDRFKTLSWMKNVLEKKMSGNKDDVLMYNKDGEVLECSRANVFFVKGDIIVTPKSRCILPGITRQLLLERQSDFGMTVLDEPIFKEYLETYDEIFLTNALKGIILVESVHGFPNLSSGPVSEEIKKKYGEILSLK
jgi:branched-subunit amino acid aminotransferase/4-amino-4-deoxychorismate lyase